MAGSQSRRPSVGGLFTSSPTVWAVAVLILLALGLLVVLRHFFGAFRVEVGAKS